jgi:hypothetical protein
LVGCLAVAAICAPAGQAARVSKPLHADLFGKNEIGQDGKKRAGDLNGRGSFSAIVEEGKLCFGMTVANVKDPVAAHIHRGGRNVNGPVVLPLVAPDDGDPGASSGCMSVASPLAAAILRRPRRYYVNVHTEDFAGGAVRGQLYRARR